ncbi:MAG: hypothetical protein HYY96_01995 [Candidatus Tectomicrobia bacterium]|nr:hypothetical protein [Candidatus Tectomicrobia bacterium]
MPDDSKYPKDLEELSKAISKAIMNSEDVRHTLYRLHRQRLVGPESFLALVLRMHDLVDLVEGAATKSRGAPGTGGKKTTRRTVRSRRKNVDPQLVDGRKLSPSELAFLEYCQKRFDETAWLREQRLRLE